jgi:signal transduction histidine kinase
MVNRTIPNLVKATTQEQIETIVAKRLRKPINSIQHAAEQGQRLIHDLLDFAKIESGNFAINIEPVEIPSVALEAISALKSIAEKCEIKLFFMNHAENGSVICDGQRIQQVLANIIGNAIKFSGKGAVVELEVSEFQENEVLFGVHDHGPGIPREKLESIFDRYYQCGEDYRQGTGLGLFIAKGIIEAHGGRIWAESDLGRGSSIYFTLSRVKVSDHQIDQHHFIHPARIKI